jgi:hypothetical protein
LEPIIVINQLFQLISAKMSRPDIFFNAFILRNNLAVVHYCDLRQAVLHVLRGPMQASRCATPLLVLLRPFRQNKTKYNKTMICNSLLEKRQIQIQNFFESRKRNV